MHDRIVNMNERLNKELRLWLGRIALDWKIPIEEISAHLGRDEVENRQRFYPELKSAITKEAIDLAQFAHVGRQCWVLQQRYDAIRFGQFVSNRESARAIHQLITDLPEDDVSSVSRIDSFLEKCASLGYADPESGKLNSSSAALLASSILTAVYPNRFADFRKKRWKGLAEELGYDLFVKDDLSYGEMVVETGKFASAVCATAKFREFWPNGEPLWTISGVCWFVSFRGSLRRPQNTQVDSCTEDFDEGTQELRSHWIRERNTSVVKRAKERWRNADPNMCCDACGFSFARAYGDHGSGFIEAHHTIPVAKLTLGAKTRVADLAKVCANCHRMLHVNNQCLSIDELKAMLRAMRANTASVKR